MSNFTDIPSGNPIIAMMNETLNKLLSGGITANELVDNHKLSDDVLSKVSPELRWHLNAFYAIEITDASGPTHDEALQLAMVLVDVLNEEAIAEALKSGRDRIDYLQAMRDIYGLRVVRNRLISALFRSIPPVWGPSEPKTPRNIFQFVDGEEL